MRADPNSPLDSLSPEEQEILQYMLRSKRRQKAMQRGIPLCDRNKEPVLSYGQLRMWLLHELNRGQASPYDTFALCLRIRGALNIDALKRSLAELVRRHEILRTTFEFRENEPAQVISEAGPPLEWADVSGLLEDDREPRLTRYIEKAKDTFFDLAVGPLFKTLLIRLNSDEHVLIITMHHIVNDAWSTGIIHSELKALYESFSRGKPSSLPDLPIQYRDFSEWQRDWLQGDELQRHLHYWKQQLAGLPVLDLPTDYPRPSIQTFNGAVELLSLSEELSGAIRDLGKHRGLTLNMIMMAALGLLLHFYSRQDDFGIGTVVTNRDREELHGLIGYFLNTLVMRLDFSGDPSILEVLERIRQISLDGFAHQHLPFENVIDEMQLDRVTDRTPLFQVSLFMLEAKGSGPLRFGNLEISPIPVANHTTRFDIEVYVVDHPSDLSVRFEYNTDLFKASTIERMLSHFQNLLEQIVANPKGRVADLQLLTEVEYRQVVEEWNQTDRAFPNQASTLHELFESQAARTPERLAVTFEGQELSYLELNRRANRLAHYLRGLGVGSGSIVGLCLEPGQDVVVGLLAILKAGGAYLPLDPAYPAERLDYMLEDSGAEILLSRERLLAGLTIASVRSVCLDRDAGAIDEQSDANLEPACASESLAYVIYTSGSTGKPKGVMGLHRGTVNRLNWMWEAYPYAADERCCQKTTLSFVDAVAEIFSPLLAGLCLVIVDEETVKDARALAELVASEGVTRLVVVPSLLRALLELDEETLSGLECVRHWVTSGERLEPELELGFRVHFPGAVLLNVYGSSEVSADVTYFDTAERGNRRGSLIGRPIANTRAYVLDDSTNPVPVGVPGELHIGGAGLARGYLGRAELTAQRFVSDPFGESGSQLYKTGDMVRYGADGVLEYLGRIDQQVKVRGYRVETGEVETALAAHSMIREAIVIVEGGERLVAYFVAEAGASVDSLTLREYLGRTLPGFMVPSVYVALEALPLTASGKVDRKELPQPSPKNKTTAESNNKPDSEMEIILADIWEDLLEIDDIESDDMFFDLGGHSLLALKMVNKFAKETGIQLPPANLIFQTLRQLAASAEASKNGSEEGSDKSELG